MTACMEICFGFVIKTVLITQGHFRVTAFVFPSNHDKQWSPAFLEMAEHLPADGKQ